MLILGQFRYIFRTEPSLAKYSQCCCTAIHKAGTPELRRSVLGGFERARPSRCRGCGDGLMISSAAADDSLLIQVKGGHKGGKSDKGHKGGSGDGDDDDQGEDDDDQGEDDDDQGEDDDDQGEDEQ
jgi:hypothetical protein